MLIQDNSREQTLGARVAIRLRAMAASSSFAPSSSSRRTVALVVASLCAPLLGVAPVMSGCAQQPDSLLSADVGPGAGSATSSDATKDAGGASAQPNQGAQKFAAIEAPMVAACGTCHDVGGIADTAFLAGPDRYHTIVSWPHVVDPDPANSVLLKHAVAGGGHSGTNLDSALLKDSLLPQVKDWLAEEAKGIAAPPADAGKLVEPFVPILGFNAVYLDALGDDFKGMAITFSADELSADVLDLGQIEVHPTSKNGVHLAHPLFTVYPAGGAADPDPVDSFSNVDQSFDVGQAGELGPGSLVLTNWKKNARLSVAFEKIELYSASPPDAGAEGGAPDGCNDVGAFTQNAAPLLQNDCFGCHGGANAQAKAAVDMSKLGKDAPAACGQIKNRVKPSDPAQSQLFVTTNPGGNAAHPYKFGGSDAKWQSFRTSVSKWIAVEQ